MAEVGDALEEVIELVEGPSYKVEGGEGGGGEGGNETEGMGEGGEGGEGPEGNPSVAEIISKGMPPEWIPLIVICSILTLILIFLFLKAFIAHKKYSTKHTQQFLTTLGILFVYPLYAMMYVSGMIIPRANAKCTFIAETYESLSLLFFLKLILCYMGGKKSACDIMKKQKVHLNAPPLCCLSFLPSVKFSKTYFIINELFVIQLIIIELVLGYVDLMMGFDQSMAYPANLIEETYSHVFHGISIASLCLSIYGLSSIYHAAEHRLEHYDIFKKFIAYKIVVTLAKAQDILFSTLSSNNVLGDLTIGAFSTHLRMHMWASTLTIFECTIIFPFALNFYNIGDYPSSNSDLPSPKKARPPRPPGKVHIADAGHLGSPSSEPLFDITRISSGDDGYDDDTDNLMKNFKRSIPLKSVPDTTAKRVLFLTDSTLSSFPVHKFEGDLTCSKRGLYKLTDIRKYMSEFIFTDFVIVSSGINDISRYHCTAEELMKFSVEFYEECSKHFPRTKFIFSSLLQTSSDWINAATDDYNTYVFELSLRYPNILFFDNYLLVNRNILLKEGNGIQINDKAVKFVSKLLITSVTNLSRCYNDPREPWPLRPSFAEKALSFKSMSFYGNAPETQ